VRRQPFPTLIRSFNGDSISRGWRIALSLLACSCGTSSNQSAATSAPRASTEAAQPSNSVWSRMKDCAEQADRVVKRDWADRPRSPDAVGLTNWENHYSPTYERCYMVVYSALDHAKTDSTLPRTIYQLIDPFERKELAACTDQVKPKSDAFCSVSVEGEESSGNCTACRSYIKDRMSK
jgi:hypothetical protein